MVVMLIHWYAAALFAADAILRRPNTLPLLQGLRRRPCAFLGRLAFCRLTTHFGSALTERVSHLPLRPQITDPLIAPVTSLYALCLDGALPLPVLYWSFAEAPTNILRFFILLI